MHPLSILQQTKGEQNNNKKYMNGTRETKPNRTMTKEALHSVSFISVCCQSAGRKYSNARKNQKNRTTGPRAANKQPHALWQDVEWFVDLRPDVYNLNAFEKQQLQMAEPNVIIPRDSNIKLPERWCCCWPLYIYVQPGTIR